MSATTVATSPGLGIEANGINVIDESERKGVPAQLFWPWCASNVSVLAVSYGSFVLGFGLGLWQALLAALVGTVVSFLLVGLVSVAGKRGSAPTLVLSRAAFGVRGNRVPGVVSYVLLVGWETVLVSLATFATATVFGRLGWGDGDLTKVVAFLVVAAVIVGAGILGFDAIMRLQKWLTIAMIVVTALYVVLTLDHVDLAAASDLPGGPVTALVGATVLVMTGFGVGWVNSAADYSRYLPRDASTRGVVWWPTFGGSLPVVVLVAYGVLLCASDDKLNQAIAADPIGALTTLLPTWFLVPFALVAVGGLVSGAVLDIYSSGLTLLTLGLRTPRWVAAAIDGVLMVLGTIYIVWVADSFLSVFMAFLIILGVPMSAWCGVFLADLLLRKRDYDQVALYDRRGVYGSVNGASVLVMVVATFVGWGLVIDTTQAGKGLSWLGYLLGPLGLGGRDGDWAFANLGVPVALVVGFLGYLALQASAVRRQEEVGVAA
ncbi:MAG: allantoin permease [Nocardioidaceae bacterium]|nr:allantoin permease [Nocardioidaceae bacterium]NUS50301.1 allantoin permease [Nocardioidaceae bacterium]